MPAVRYPDGHGRPLSRSGVEAAAVLGLFTVWPTLLDHLPTPEANRS